MKGRFDKPCKSTEDGLLEKPCIFRNITFYNETHAKKNIKKRVGKTFSVGLCKTCKISNPGAIKIRLKSLLVLRTGGNHPTSRKSANDIAASNPPRQNRSFVVKFTGTLTKTEMDAQILQLFKIFFDKSVAEIFVQSYLHV